MIGREETALSCAREGLDGISRNIFSLKGLSSIGTGCPGRGLSHHPWSYLIDLEIQCSGTWFSGGPFCNLNDSVILNTAYNLKVEWKEQLCYKKEQLKESQDRKNMKIDVLTNTI